MSTATEPAAEAEAEAREEFKAARRKVRRRTRLTIGVLAFGVLYLVMSWLAFDISGILRDSEPDRASTLARDSVSYRTFVVRDLRSEEWIISVEGKPGARLTEDPAWVSRSADDSALTVDLGDGVTAVIRDDAVSFTVPDYGAFDIGIDGRELSLDLPDRIYEEERVYEPTLIDARVEDYRIRQRRLADGAFNRKLDEIDSASERFALRADRWLTQTFGAEVEIIVPPEERARAAAFYEDKIYTPWFSVAGTTLDARIRPDARIRIVAGSRIEIQRAEFGWEHFFFDPKSPLRDATFSEVVDLALDDERLDPEVSNIAFIWSEFLRNEEWQHNDTFVELFNTFLMALLGTFFAAFFGLPLAFLAAKNFTAPQIRTNIVTSGVLTLGVIGVLILELTLRPISGDVLSVYQSLTGGVTLAAPSPGPEASWFASGSAWALYLVLWALQIVVFLAGLAVLMAVMVGANLLATAGLNRLCRAIGVASLGAYIPAATWRPFRFVSRRFFDFLRGIDMLIWSLLFFNAFGLGPLTGALAIIFTDTGTLGKLFSEALENIDKRQVEGVSATGASQVQRYRYGVIPQILPVFISQGLYFFESNIRSATLIGALGAGGIGLLLVQGINTQQRWEYVFFLIILIVILVIAVDVISGWLRRRLIEGGGRRASVVGAVLVGAAGVGTAAAFGFEFFPPEEAATVLNLWLFELQLPLDWQAWAFSGLFTLIYLALIVLTLRAIAGAARARRESPAADVVLNVANT